MKSSRESSKSKSVKGKELPILLRFYVYSLHGCIIDTFYFALLDSLNEWRLILIGRTNVLVPLIYGSALLLVEHISSYMKHRNVPFYIRGLVYTFVGYTFEFSTGYFLSMIGQSFWDYTDYSYNFKGIIIPHIAPGWFLLGLAVEKIIIDGTKNLTLVK